MVRKLHLKSQIGKKKKGYDYPEPTFPKDNNRLKLSSFPMSPPWFPEGPLVCNVPAWLTSLQELAA